MSRNVDKAFSKATARIEEEQRKRVKPSTSASDPIIEEKAPDAIKRILDAWKNKHYFKLIQLPEPTADDLGKPIWGCTPNDVSRAFRRLSILVHPDKNPGDDARKAFEALNVSAHTRI